MLCSSPIHDRPVSSDTTVEEFSTDIKKGFRENNICTHCYIDIDIRVVTTIGQGPERVIITRDFCT